MLITFTATFPARVSFRTAKLLVSMKKTSLVIVEEFRHRHIDPMAVPSVIVAGHAPFSWGKNAEDAVHNAVVLEEISAMALATRSLNSGIKIQPELSDKHYLRKHGANAYYGQR